MSLPIPRSMLTMTGVSLWQLSKSKGDEVRKRTSKLLTLSISVRLNAARNVMPVGE